MKFFITNVILLFSISLFAQNEHPTVNDLRDRIPELPQTFPGEITIDPTRTIDPLPPPPPIITPTTPPPIITDGQDDKIVFFVHGFGGTRDKWTQVMTASEFAQNNTPGFQARELQAIAVPAYQQNGDMLAAVNDVGFFIHQTAKDMPDSIRRQNFIIGHSQGGIVGKFLVNQDFCTNNTQAFDNYYGLVTFGSALNGAQIMNSRQDDKIDALANEFCNVFADAFVADIGPLHFIIELIGENEQGQTPIMNLCQAFEEDVIPLFFSNLETTIAEDYVVGSQKVKRANDCLAPEVHKLAFYGVEPYAPVGEAIFPNPIFYRTVQHFFKDVNTSPHWGANDDATKAEEFSMAATELLIEAAELEQKALQWQNLFPLSPLGILPTIHANNLLKRAEKKRKLNRFYYDINDRWMCIIGATGSVDITVNTNSGTSCTCYVYDDTIMEYSVDAETPSECVHPFATDCNFEYNQPYTETYTISFENKFSDGVVLAESAQHMTGSTHSPQRLQLLHPQNEEEIDTGSSHMQMRNDHNVRDALQKLYNGEYDFWFYTPIAE